MEAGLVKGRAENLKKSLMSGWAPRKKKKTVGESSSPAEPPLQVKRRSLLSNSPDRTMSEDMRESHAPEPALPPAPIVPTKKRGNGKSAVAVPNDSGYLAAKKAFDESWATGPSKFKGRKAQKIAKDLLSFQLETVHGLAAIMDSSADSEQIDNLQSELDEARLLLGMTQSTASAAEEKLKEAANSYSILQSERDALALELEDLKKRFEDFQFASLKKVQDTADSVRAQIEADMKAEVEDMGVELLEHGYHTFRAKLLKKYPDLDLAGIDDIEVSPGEIGVQDDEDEKAALELLPADALEQRE